MTDDPLRTHVLRLLDWEDAHVNFDSALAGIPPSQRGLTPPGLPYSAWQLLEHLRLTQADILDFCRNSSYQERKWPDAYWPASAAPSSSEVWEQSITDFQRDREELRRLGADPKRDLFARIPHGTGQTYLRELLLVADHNAYHLGQLIAVRRLLGTWPAA